MKRFTSLLIAVAMLLSFISVVSVSADNEYNSAMNDFIKFKAEEFDESPDNIMVDYFWPIGDELYLERLYSEMSLTMMYYYNIDKYLYQANGSADNVFIFDRKNKKEYNIFQAYENDVINLAVVKKISGMLTNVQGVKLEENILTLNAGESGSIEEYRNWKSKNKNIASMMNEKLIGNKVYKLKNAVGLQKGTTVFTAKTKGGKTVSCKVIVKTNPKLIKNKKTIKSIKVKKGSKASIKINGKADLIDNAYTNTKYAKIVSDKSAKTIKVKGLKKGTTTLIIKVNGVKTLKLKVKVK